MYFFVLLR